jgi:YHS domain-containing protein
MNTRYALILLVAMSLMGLVISGGCKKEPKPAVPPAEVNQAAASAAETEQMMCPVMGGAIDKTVFVEYKGKKVYFCCSVCKGKFEADPEKYIAKLPQFAK